MKETRFEIGGVEFASGLEWVTLDADGNERPAALGGMVVGRPGPASRKELARIEDAQSAVWRKTKQGVIQMGVSRSKPGAVSLAAFAAEVLGREGVDHFLAVFRVEENIYVLVGVAEGLIQITAETAGGEEDIRRLAQEELSLTDASVVIIAPPGFGIGEGRNDTIDDLVARAEKRDFQNARLIRLGPNYMAIGASAVVMTLVIGGGAGGWYWYQQKQAEEQARIAQEMMRQQLAQQQQAQKPVIPTVEEIPVSQALRACYHAITHAELNPGGWVLRGAKCVPGDLTLEFERDGSRIAFLRKVYPKAVVSLDGNIAQAHVPVEMRTIKVKADSLSKIDEGADRINDTALSLGLMVSLTKRMDAQPAALPGRPQSNQQAQADWKTLDWTLKGLAFGQETTDFNFRGMSFKEMTFTPKDGVIVKGEFHGH